MPIPILIKTQMDDILKILMLEDSEDDAEIVLQLLKKTSLRFESRLVMNKADFLLALHQFNPDIILSDNSLPQFSATEALEIIHQRGLQLPFILITGTVSDEFAANIIKLGADDYILKDRLVRLPAAINSALLKKRSASGMKLKEEEIMFNASLLAAVGQAIIATDLEGNVSYWNGAAEKMYGWSAPDAMGCKITDLTPSPEAKEYGNEIMEELKKGYSWSGEYMVQRKDGAIFPAFVTISPIYGSDMQMKGMIGFQTTFPIAKDRA
ncbi:MAG: PAS domain S-box protein [Ferruginibacter sp.]